MEAMTTRRYLPIAASAFVLSLVFGVVVSASPAGAHTEADLVAVPAGSVATLNLKPTHGCDGSPTVEVAIQAPLTGAVAGEVEGWTASASDDGSGNTVAEWTGGTLPPDQEGAFPITFTVPDTVGELLVFPSVQVCENGEELAWIDGDPTSDYPAPRLLVLPADAEPAASIDDVPADAPGRDQLVAIVDVDNPADDGGTDDPATTTEPTSTSEDASITTVPLDDATTSSTAPLELAEPEDGSDDDDSGAAPLIIVAVIVVVALAGGGYYLSTRRSTD